MRITKYRSILRNLFLRFRAKSAIINSAIINSARINSAIINSLKVVLIFNGLNIFRGRFHVFCYYFINYGRGIEIPIILVVKEGLDGSKIFLYDYYFEPEKKIQKTIQIQLRLRTRVGWGNIPLIFPRATLIAPFSFCAFFYCAEIKVARKFIR